MLDIEKEITFICTDKVEKQCCDSIAIEAEKRGYKVKFSKNPFEKCEIGFYLSHFNYPKNSKFSIITLHDLQQQHGYWPVMWKNEFWNNFDIGFLPSKEWADMWHNASCYRFVRPKYGCYLSGWIKADATVTQNFSYEKEKLIEEYKLDKTKKTILYAPSWEWGGRQLEMAEAVRDLDVNLIIKQFPISPDKFPEQAKIIKETDKKTIEMGLKNVFILDSNINIFNAISLCDVLVSEESSTLTEAMLMDKIVVAVTDWMVPDGNIIRKPECNFTYVNKTLKKDLRKTLINILENQDSYGEKVLNYRKSNFPNIGNGAKIVMDVIDNILFKTNNEVQPIEELPLIPTPKEFKKSISKRKELLRRFHFKKTIIERNRLLLTIWNFLKRIRDNFRNKGK